MNLDSRNILKGKINKIWLFAISMLYGLNAFAGLGGISIRDMRVDQWQWFTLDINMNGEDVHHFEATLSYDPQMLVVKEVNEGNFLNPTGEEETVWSAPEIDEKAGIIQVAGSLEKLAQPVSGWGQIARVVFEPVAVGETVVAATSLAIFNQLGDDITPEGVKRDGKSILLGSGTITVDLYHQVAGEEWITRWWTLDGPIDNTGGFMNSSKVDWLSRGTEGVLTQESVSTVAGLPMTLMTPLDLPKNGGQLNWTVKTIDPEDGRNMSNMYWHNDYHNFDTYAIIVIESPDDRQTTMYPAHDDYAQIWINGDKVYDNPTWTGAPTTVTDPTEVSLNKGSNVLLFRCGEGGGHDYFNLHFSPSDDDLEIYPSPNDNIPIFGEVILSAEQGRIETVDRTFAIDLNLFTTEELQSYAFDLVFDPLLLQAVEVDYGDFLNQEDDSVGDQVPTTFGTPIYDNENGRISKLTGLRNAPSGATGFGSLVSVSFKAIAVGETTIKIENAELLDPSSNELEPVVSDSRLQIYPIHGEVRGRITTSYGWPVTGVSVQAVVDGNVVGLPDLTNGDGYYLIDNITHVGEVTIQAQRPGLLPIPPKKTSIELEKVSEVNFVLEPKNPNRSTVTDEGFIQNWLILGPVLWENNGTRLMADQLSPRAKREARFPVQEIEEKSIQPEAGQYGTGLAKHLRWTLHSNQGQDRQIWFGDLLGDHQAVAYAYTRIRSERDQTVTLQVSHDESIIIWLNEELVHLETDYIGFYPDRIDEVEVDLKEGWNTLLVKIGNRDHGWGFEARFAKKASLFSEEYTPLTDLIVSPQPAAESGQPGLTRGTFNVALKKGLNNMAIPVRPDQKMDSKALAKKIGATLVIRLDPDTKEFVPFVLEHFESSNFLIDGGIGVIVNVKEDQVVSFSGTVWDNVSGGPSLIGDLPNDHHLVNSIGKWAFSVLVDPSVVRGSTTGQSDVMQMTNLRTQQMYSLRQQEQKGSLAVSAMVDSKQRPIIELDDRVEIRVGQYRWHYTITDTDLENAFAKVALSDDIAIPNHTRLLPNYPNPFNPETWIPFQLTDDANVQLNIFEVGGNRVRSIDVGQTLAGSYVDRHRAIYWNGRTDLGEHVSSGIYFVQFMTDNTSETRRMVILK